MYLYIFLFTVCILCIVYRNILPTACIRLIGYLLIIKKKWFDQNQVAIYTIEKILLDKFELNIDNSIEVDTLIGIFGHINNLTIFYRLNSKKYIIIYSNTNSIINIPFPMYNINDIVKENAFDITDDNIIIAEITGDDNLNLTDDNKNDILAFIKSLSGPKGDFYKSFNYSVDHDMVISLINTQLNLNINKKSNIEILYSDGNQYTI